MSFNHLRTVMSTTDIIPTICRWLYRVACKAKTYTASFSSSSFALFCMVLAILIPFGQINRLTYRALFFCSPLVHLESPMLVNPHYPDPCLCCLAWQKGLQPILWLGLESWPKRWHQLHQVQAVTNVYRHPIHCHSLLFSSHFRFYSQKLHEWYQFPLEIHDRFWCDE